jgi:MFS family permease
MNRFLSGLLRLQIIIYVVCLWLLSSRWQYSESARTYTYSFHLLSEAEKLTSVSVYWIEYACLQTQPDAFTWRFPLGLQIIILFIILIVISFYPESPRHLAKTGRLDEARWVLEHCRINPQPVLIEQELQEIHEAIRLEATSTSRTYTSMLFSKDRLHTRRRILLGAGVQVMQKFTGIDFITSYAPEMFSLSGYTGEKPNLLAGGNLISYTASLALSIYLIEKVGRRNLMLIGCTIMGVLLIVGGILANQVTKYSESDPEKASKLGAGVAAILYIYTFTYGSTWLTVWSVPPSHLV